MREQTAEVSAPIEQEFLSVIREYERVIYKVCYLYANPNAPLNDLYQDVVLNLWKAYPKFRKECKVSTWIYRIALNTCISFYRKEKNVPEIVSLTRDTDWAIEAHDPINEMLKQLYQMINQLGQLDKSIILLYLEDKSYEEIAEITGLTVTNVATKLSRIKDKLKSCLLYTSPSPRDYAASRMPSSALKKFFFLMIRRPPRSTHCISSAASDVYKRQEM